MAAAPGRAEKFPLDFAALEKGTWIEGERLDLAVTVKRAHPMWGLELSKLCERIYHETEIRARVDHNRIRLMTDAEAGEYGERRFKYHLNGLGREKRKLATVDMNKLDDGQRALHEHRLRAVGNVTLAARKAMRKESRILSLLASNGRDEDEED